MFNIVESSHNLFLIFLSRYFILIDDIWHASVWQIIKHVFPNNNCCSRILITTRIRSVANTCSGPNGLVYNMKPLNESDSTHLLITRAFGSVDFCLPYDVYVMLTSEGIPLFITEYADCLKEEQEMPWYSRRKSPEFYSAAKCRRLLKQFKWDMELSRDYKDLPVELMLLLQYMSMFPRGYTFEKDCLVFKWMNEGLTHGNLPEPDGSKNEGLTRTHSNLREPGGSEKEAEWYFAELVDRNIITRVAANWEHNFDDRGPHRWQVNHFMLQFISSITWMTGFVFNGAMLGDLLLQPTVEPGSETWIPRRLALHYHEPDNQGQKQAIDDWAENVRSLSVSGLVEQVPLDKFTYLVVLDLEAWENLKDEDLLQICSRKMLQLRYLSVRNTQISKLPLQIKELCSLRALDVSHTHITELPPQALELDCLIKLDLRSTKIRQLPEKIVELRNLQYLLVGDDGATLNLSEYTASFVKALGDLNHLREVAITWSFHQCNEDAYVDALLSSFQKWRQLKSLTIHCGLGSSMEFLDPPKDLERFKVTTGRFISVPRWIEGMVHLIFLQITVCKLAPCDLQILKALPKLQSLILGLEFIPREEIVIENMGFHELLKFSVDCPVPWLTFRQGAMPKLTCLQLKFCSGPVRRASVPSGIWNLQRITEIGLHYNSKWCENSSNVKMTVDAVKKEVAEHRNPIDLVINGTVHDVQEFDEGVEMASGIQWT